MDKQYSTLILPYRNSSARDESIATAVFSDAIDDPGWVRKAFPDVQGKKGSDRAEIQGRNPQ